MKNFQQNLLMTLAFALCALCAWQWHFATVQRVRLGDREQEISRMDTAIQGYTNDLEKAKQQVTRLEESLAGLNGDLRQALKTNSEIAIQQKREIARLGANNDTLMSELIQYTNAVAALQSNLDTAYDEVKKRDAIMGQLAAMRDEYIQKYTNTVNQYNELVSKYTNVVDRLTKLQSAPATNPPRR
jgi:chromosome segregation ATPase